MSTYTVADQVDPEALQLWNEYVAEPNQATLAPLAAVLREDFPSFCALLLKIRPKGGGYIIPLIFNQVQRRVWSEMCRLIAEGKPLWFVILKFRQAGMSTFWCAWIFWQMWRQRDIQAMIVAHILPTAELMIETMRVFFDELPDMFKPLLREGNHGATLPRGEMYFAGQRAWCTTHLAKNVDPRGAQVTHVLETEHASYPNADELNTALMPQLPSFGSEARLRSSFVIESTPKGQNSFHDLYWDAKNGNSLTFTSMFFPWFIFDEQYGAEAPATWRMTDEEKALQAKLSRIRQNDYDGHPVSRNQMYWRRGTIETECNNSLDLFDREYPSDDTTCFLLASRSVFREYSRYLFSCVEDAKERAAETWAKYAHEGAAVSTTGPVRLRLVPKIEQRGQWTIISNHVPFVIHPYGRWLVWAPPVAGHKYAVGADSALGLDEHNDPSAICVIDVTAGQQVAEFVDHVGPENFAQEIAAVGYWYNTALLVPEINSIGYVVLNRLIANIQYPNLYKWPKFDEVSKFTNKRGWSTNVHTKQLMISTIMHYLEEESLQIASFDLLNEMSTYEQKQMADHIEFNAQRGRHDDRVMAYGLALMGIQQTPHLLVELGRNPLRIPSARDLHLASGPPEATPIPKQIADRIAITHKIPWNPFGEFVA